MVSFLSGFFCWSFLAEWPIFFRKTFSLFFLIRVAKTLFDLEAWYGLFWRVQRLTILLINRNQRIANFFKFIYSISNFSIFLNVLGELGTPKNFDLKRAITLIGTLYIFLNLLKIFPPKLKISREKARPTHPAFWSPITYIFIIFFFKI